MSGALLDTSVVVAAAEVADQLPDQAAISVITLGELRAGMLRARNETQRNQRRARLEATRAAFCPISVDEHVASHYGELLAWARDQSRSEKATDLLITATAAATGRQLYTADRAQAGLARDAGTTATLIATPSARG